MAEMSPPGFNMINDQRYWNENTPPDRIKVLPLPPTKWKRVSPSATMNSPENLMKKLEKTNMNESDDDDDDGMSKQSFNLGHIVDYSQSDVNKQETNDSSGKTESFCTEESSISSNGYSSNSGVNDSSIFNSSDDDHPDSSTPHQLIVSNAKYKMLKPPNLVIEEASDEQNHQEISNLAQYSPVRSPFPPNTCNESLFGNEETPESLRFDTPPKGTYLKDSEMKMVHLLKRFGLGHFAFTFIEQEVDVELFLTLNDQDLKEIGIKRNTDRNILLSVISECNTRLFGYKNEQHL